MRLDSLSFSHLCSCWIDGRKITGVLAVFLVLVPRLLGWLLSRCISVDAISH